MTAKQVLAEAKQFVKATDELKDTTKKRLIEIIGYRLKGFTLEAIAEHYGVAKSRIHKLEKMFVEKGLTGTQHAAYWQLVHDAKKNFGSIK